MKVLDPYGQVVTSLYHGTSIKAAEATFAAGGAMHVPSWWGTFEIAQYYAEEEANAGGKGMVIFELPFTKFDPSKIVVDRASVSDPITMALPNDEHELQRLWGKSKNTWQDCLRIYGSIKYEGEMQVTEEDVAHWEEDTFGGGE